MQFAHRLDHVETSAIRELFKLLGKPGIISFAGGFPDSAMFDVEGIRDASQRVLTDNPGPALQYGATEGHGQLREEIARFMAGKGVQGVDASDLIVTTGSQQALDLIAKTLLNEGDVALVEAPTFLATIQCFRLYGPKVMGVPIDADGVRVDLLEEMVAPIAPSWSTSSPPLAIPAVPCSALSGVYKSCAWPFSIRSWWSKTILMAICISVPHRPPHCWPCRTRYPAVAIGCCIAAACPKC